MKESRMLRRIKQEGELIQKRADILEVLRIRFGVPAAAEFTATLDEMDELGRLDPLLGLAVTCSTVAEFRAGLQTQATTP